MDLTEKILKAIEIMIDNKLKSKSSYDRRITGRVVSVNYTTKIAKVLLNEQQLEIPYRSHLSIKSGDIVDILIRNNDYSTKIIDDKKWW